MPNPRGLARAVSAWTFLMTPNITRKSVLKTGAEPDPAESGLPGSIIKLSEAHPTGLSWSDLSPIRTQLPRYVDSEASKPVAYRG